MTKDFFKFVLNKLLACCEGLSYARHKLKTVLTVGSCAVNTSGCPHVAERHTNDETECVH